jgi:hypothetical protein
MTENLTFQAIPIDSITLDPDLVVRHKPIDRRHIERMLPLAKSGGEFPPVRIFEDDEGVRRLTDGLHRITAFREAGRVTVTAEIFPPQTERPREDRQWVGMGGESHMPTDSRVLEA